MTLLTRKSSLVSCEVLKSVLYFLVINRYIAYNITTLIKVISSEQSENIWKVVGYLSYSNLWLDFSIKQTCEIADDYLLSKFKSYSIVIWMTMVVYFTDVSDQYLSLKLRTLMCYFVMLCLKINVNWGPVTQSWLMLCPRLNQITWSEFNLRLFEIPMSLLNESLMSIQIVMAYNGNTAKFWPRVYQLWTKLISAGSLICSWHLWYMSLTILGEKVWDSLACHFYI